MIWYIQYLQCKCNVLIILQAIFEQIVLTQKCSFEWNPYHVYNSWRNNSPSAKIKDWTVAWLLLNRVFITKNYRDSFMKYIELSNSHQTKMYQWVILRSHIYFTMTYVPCIDVCDKWWRKSNKEKQIWRQ